MESKNNTKSLLNCISQACYFDYITDEWYNGKIGCISDHTGQYIYRFYANTRDANGNLRYVSNNEVDHPIVAIGIVAYWLHHRLNENRITTIFGPAYFSSISINKQFEDYTAARLVQYKKTFEQKPSSWRSDIECEFYTKYIIPNERKLNRQSEALFEYITPADRKLVKELMKEYLLFLKKKKDKYPSEPPKHRKKQTMKKEEKKEVKVRILKSGELEKHFKLGFDKKAYIPTLETKLASDQSDKELARVALVIYESQHFIKKDYKTFSKWYRDFCYIVDCEYHKSYVQSALKKKLEDVRKEYYFL